MRRNIELLYEGVGVLRIVGCVDNNIIVVRGGGDLATGVVQKFYRVGFHVLILEASEPTAIRRGAALCEAVYDADSQVEDVACRRIYATDEAKVCWQDGIVPLLVDPAGDTIAEVKPAAVIDAIIAKRNLGTLRDMADVTIGLGPGFYAGKDVHVVIETKRGHDLGRLIFEGSAMPDTGMPGEVAGESVRRVLRAPATGVIRHEKRIGNVVKQDDVLFYIDDTETRAPFNGLLRGLIREGIHVTKGQKVADIDPRTDVDWRTISDKARCLGGSALEAYLLLKRS